MRPKRTIKRQLSEVPAHFAETNAADLIAVNRKTSSFSSFFYYITREDPLENATDDYTDYSLYADWWKIAFAIDRLLFVIYVGGTTVILLIFVFIVITKKSATE
jgi:hypothetical protein